MSGIITPGQMQQEQAGRQPVTKAELNQVLSLLQRDFNALAQAIELQSVRQDALTRGWDNLVYDGRLYYDKFTQYVKDMAEQFVPYIVETLQRYPTIHERVARAQEWNKDHATMRINLDDLNLLPLAPFATREDRLSVLGKPATKTFWDLWQDTLPKDEE